MTVTQSNATISAILTLCDENGYSHTQKETVYKDLLTKDDITSVVNTVTAGLIAGEISMTDKSKAKFGNDEKAIRRYVVGLVNDRLRKSKVLNGGVTHEYAEPGKLKNGRDPELKALNQVLALETSPAIKAEIQEAIDARRAELKQQVVKKTVEINYDALPQELRLKLSI